MFAHDTPRILDSLCTLAGVRAVRDSCAEGLRAGVRFDCVFVDPEILRAFAAHVDAVAGTIGGFDVGSIAQTSADGLPGSETQWGARQIGSHLAGAAADLVNDIRALGTAVRGAGDRYEVEDSALADTFEQLF